MFVVVKKQNPNCLWLLSFFVEKFTGFCELGTSCHVCICIHVNCDHPVAWVPGGMEMLSVGIISGAEQELYLFEGDETGKV